jgi:HEPN domain-containing protein
MARSMPTAPDVNEPEYWHHRAKEARRLAERMTDEKAEDTMLSVAEECEELAVQAAMLHFDKLFVRRLIHKTKGS